MGTCRVVSEWVSWERDGVNPEITSDTLLDHQEMIVLIMVFFGRSLVRRYRSIQLYSDILLTIQVYLPTIQSNNGFYICRGGETVT